MSFETIAVNFTHSNCEEIQKEALSSHSERIELRRRSEVSPKEVGTGIALGKAKRRPSHCDQIFKKACQLFGPL